jgi:squalene-associated FAD-dependent desaturase
MPFEGRSGFAAAAVATEGMGHRVGHRQRAEMRAAIVGGGLAGLAAALELVDAGHDVTLYEARPTLGGKVQTLPTRDGDPQPPPDNGQHIALGCFTDYLSFLERIGSAGQVTRRPLELRVIDEHGRVAHIGYGVASLLRYTHVSLADRLRIAGFLARLSRLQPAAGETFAEFLRRHGQSQRSVDRFWDVFVRPGLNLPAGEVQAEPARFTVLRALRSGRAASDLVLPAAPLGEMHGDAAKTALEGAGGRVETGVRIDGVDDLHADAVVLAVPPDEGARILGEHWAYAYSPIVSVHLLFDRVLLESPMAALLGSDAHWVFDRGALTGHMPTRGQYLTVVSSAVPELLEIRGHELVDRIAAQVAERLGAASLLWSRVSREPEATVALRPGIPSVPVRIRDGLVLAGAWQAAPWPPTMEAAVRSGRRAARMLSDVATKVAA